MIVKILALLVCAALIAGGLYVWLFPEVRTKALEWASPWLRSVPGVEKFLGSETKSRETAQSRSVSRTSVSVPWRISSEGTFG